MISATISESSPRLNLRTLNTTEAPKLTIEQMSQTFEKWIKIAIDNSKINPKDTWNVPLIDYFSELTLLKEGNSINFQKASCTLDGCVKIYSLRVDSVADETGKLLSGFTMDSNADSKNKFSKNDFQKNNIDSADEMDDNDGASGEFKKPKKKVIIMFLYFYRQTTKLKLR